MHRRHGLGHGQERERMQRISGPGVRWRGNAAGNVRAPASATQPNYPPSIDRAPSPTIRNRTKLSKNIEQD